MKFSKGIYSRFKLIKILFLIFYLNINLITLKSETKDPDTSDIADLSSELELLLDTKISVASKYDQKVSEVPGSVSIITSEDIDRWGYKTLSDALMSQRGFFRRNDRMYEYMGIRGLERPNSYCNNILLLINGHIFNDNIYSSPFFENDLSFNLNTIERIEVVRGPGSAIYGTSAMTAVVNIITKDATTIDGIRLTGAFGSFGRKEGSFQIGKHLFKDFKFVLAGKYGYQDGQDLYFQEFDSIQYNNGIAVGLDWQKYYSIFADINYKNWTLSGFYNYRQKAIPTATWEMEFNKKTPYGLDQRSYIELKFDERFSSNTSFLGKIYYDVYKYNGEYTYQDTNFDSNLGIWAGTELQFIWDLSVNNRFTIGTEYKYNFNADYKLWYSDTVLFDENYPYYNFSIYLQDQWQIFENLSATLGIRHDQYDKFEGSTSPRFAVNYNPWNPTTLKFIYAQAFRVPNIYELYYTDYITQIANDKLVPEKIQSLEFAINQKINNYVFATISLYYNKMSNLIDQMVIKSDSINEYIQFQNIGNVDGYGFEFELDTKLPFGLWGYLSYSYQFLKDIQTSQKLSNSPIHSFKLGVSQKFFQCIFIGAEFLWESERITSYNTTTTPYLLSNLYLSIKPMIKKQDNEESIFNRFNLSLKLNNIFDTKYSLPAALDFRQVSIPQNGLNFILEASINF